MSESKCCPTDATASSDAYVPRGKIAVLTDDAHLVCYITGTLGEAAVFVVPDIFGLAVPVSLRFLDELAASSGLPTVAVDFFRGKPWRPEDFPPREGQDIGKWIGETVPPAKVRADAVAVIGALQREHGVKRIAGLGFCWGGKIVFALSDLFVALASPHPSFLTLEDVKAAGAKPVCLLPSRDEDEALYASMAAALAPYRASHVKRYETARHGWCAARADCTEGSEARRDFDDACKVLASFFRASL